MKNEQIIKDTAEYNFKQGFQKGKLEQKKEELRFLDTIDCGHIDCRTYTCINIKERIKQLSKEIGGIE